MRTEVIGDATLILGDCLAWLENAPACFRPGVAAIVSSPPYNQMMDMDRPPSGLWGDRQGGRGFVERWQANGYSDDMPEPAYQQWQTALFASLARVCTPTASLFYNHQLRWRDGLCLHPIDWFKPAGWVLRSEIIWDRGGGMMFNARMFCRFDERLLWMVRRADHKWNQESVGLGSIWRISKEQNKAHPVAYPLELPTRCIGATTDAGDVVMDPFMGSGTTGVAALSLGRKFIGIEIDPGYFDIACRRIEEAYRQPRLFEEPVAKPIQEVLF